MSDYYPDSDSDIEDRLNVLIRAMDACAALHTALNHPILVPNTHGYTKGKKYARVWVQQWDKDPYGPTPDALIKGQRMVAFFVDLTTGDVWKAGGWKGPTLNFVRGSIMTKEGRAALTFEKMGKSGHYYAGF